MSVLLNFSIFPTDKGKQGISEYVSKVLKMIKETGVDYQLNSMGTTIETDTLEEALSIVHNSYKVLEPYTDRVYSSITMDIRKGRKNGMLQKMNSIKEKIGNINC